MNKSILDYHNLNGGHNRSFHDPMQRPISAKIDDDVYDMLEAEMGATGKKRNRIINLAIRWYLDELDEARRMKAAGFIE